MIFTRARILRRSLRSHRESDSKCCAARAVQDVHDQAGSMATGSTAGALHIRHCPRGPKDQPSGQRNCRTPARNRERAERARTHVLRFAPVSAADRERCHRPVIQMRETHARKLDGCETIVRDPACDFQFEKTPLRGHQSQRQRQLLKFAAFEAVTGKLCYTGQVRKIQPRKPNSRDAMLLDHSHARW